MAQKRSAGQAQLVTTATYDISPFSYAQDPSGVELRRALLLPPRQSLVIETKVLLLIATATATLGGGVLRILLS